MKIGILDYGMGNLGSVSYALKRMGKASSIIHGPKAVEEYDGLIIPGVGSFGPAMERLETFRDGIIGFAQSGKPMLGICLGMQVLFEQGTERGTHEGLSLIGGKVEMLKGTPKLPHVGWNTIELEGKSRLMERIPNRSYAYFAHSYACEPDFKGSIIATTGYGNTFVSAVEQGNVLGVQFHPEKSGAIGELILKNFMELAKECK
ncbi:imidazole glycerol phosphate synthase subunit HisH [Candidatus Micrarchaeota archaeon]|nr:imidazole glycerol phosphate synthase subunit HisH [Candidatus Micrarchaeota archaeon]